MPWRLLLILLLAALALYGASRLERRSYVVHEPVSGEARRNPMLAAGELMQARGRQVRHLLGSPGLFPLPGPDTLIVLDSHRAGLTSARVEALYQWVAEGGTLLVEALPMQSLITEYAATAERWQRHDPLLYPLDITTRLTADDDVDDPDSNLLFIDLFSNAASLFQSLCHAAEGSALAEECITALCNNRERWHDTLIATRHDGLRYAGFRPRVTLWHPGLQASDSDAPPRTGDKRHHQPAASYEKNAALSYAPGEPKMYFDSTSGPIEWLDEMAPDRDALRQRLSRLGTRLAGHADSDLGTHLLQMDIGEGRIIAASDLDIWRNAGLHYLDHAWLLDYFADDSRAVWFVRGVEVEKLPAWLWRHAAPLLVALALLVALLVWRQLPRRAALRDDETTRPADFLGHLLASGRLLWRAGERTALLAPLREEVSARLARHPQSRGLDDAGRQALAARLANLPEPAVHAALTETPDTPERLTTLVGTLQQLRRSL